MRYEYLSDFELYSFSVLSIGFSKEKSICRAKSSRNQFIIHYVSSGCGYYNGNKVKAGEGFIIPPEYYADYFPDDNDPWELLWIILSPTAYELSSKIYPCDNNYIFKYGFSDLISSIGAEITKNTPSGYNKADAWNVYNLVVNEQIREATAPDSESCDTASLAKRYIDVYYYKQITVSEICDILHCSHTYLYKEFKAAYGVSPKDYLTHIKIKHAKELLTGTDLTVSRVAQSVGFEDPLAFSAFFKKNAGCSPRDFKSKLNH